VGDVVRFTGITTIGCTPEEVLEKAKEWGMEACCVVGFDKDNVLQFGGSTSDVAQVILMLELAKNQMIKDITGED